MLSRSESYRRALNAIQSGAIFSAEISPVFLCHNAKVTRSQ